MLIGIDVGGTKTRVVAIEGRRVEVLEGEGANPAVVGEKCIDIVSTLLTRILERVGADPGSVELVGIGSAGVGRGYWSNLFAKALERAGVDPSRMELFEDFRTAYTSCFVDEPGIVAISGTGSSIYGECEGIEVRVGGWGHLLDDEGSAYQVGRDGMAAALRYFDGRGPETKLLEEMLRYLGIDSPELVVPKVYGSPNPKKLVAGFAPRVVKAALEGDEVAKEILRRYAKQLAQAIAAAIKRLRERGCSARLGVAIVGGFWSFVEKHVRGLVLEELRASVGEGIELVEKCVDPACGALVRALIARGEREKAREVHRLCAEAL